jgi:pimeloyl-ACP methyl ester carboxylesterase
MKEKLILLHGALGSKNQFNPVIERLKEFYEVYSINFEGHGGNESLNEFSIQVFTENVIDYMQINSIDKATIFGYSMGGYVALNLALKAPKKIKKIITLGTKFKWDMESAEKEVKMLDPIVIEEKVPLFAERLKQEHDPQNWKVVMKKTAKMMIDMAEGARLIDSDFKKIHQKVIIGIGSLDTMVSYEESEYISRLLPNSKLIQLEGVKHPIDKIGTDELIEYIRSN